MHAIMYVSSKLWLAHHCQHGIPYYGNQACDIHYIKHISTPQITFGHGNKHSGAVYMY